MNKRLPIIIAMALVLISYGYMRGAAWEMRAQIRRESPPGYLFPAPAVKILTFGFKNVASDLIFLKLATFVGGRVGNQSALQEEGWAYLERGLDLVIDLDPYFVDPYFLAESLFAWDAQKPEVANRLLDKGMAYRTSDWRLPYFAGFNSFYFMQDYAAGGDYIARAAEMPGSPSFLVPLSARLSYYGGRSQTAILFLRGMMAEIDDAQLLMRLQRRLLALERAAALEEAIDHFEEEVGRKFAHFDELVSGGYLENLPVDPYGGEWMLMGNGRVFSTSKFAERFLEDQKETGK